VITMKHKQDKVSKITDTSVRDEDQKQNEKSTDKNNIQADALYQFLKPLHNLPRGKNTWNPWIISQWWFWPVSALFLIILFYVYPYIWDFFAG
jgi:hypothetical protein